jgi:hypothetical protein
MAASWAGRIVKLTAQKNVRMTDLESKAVKRAARDAGLTESVWIRLIVRVALGDTDLLMQLSRAAIPPRPRRRRARRSTHQSGAKG